MDNQIKNYDDVINDSKCDQKIIIQMIFENKYTHLKNKKFRELIFEKLELSSLVFSLISKDIICGIYFNVIYYAKLLVNLITNDVLTKQCWNPSHQEIDVLFKFCPSTTIDIVKLDMISFEKLLAVVGIKCASDILTNLLINKIICFSNYSNNANNANNNDVMNTNNENTKYVFPLKEIEFMLNNNVPINLSKTSYEILKIIIRNYPDDAKFNLHNLLANIFMNCVPEGTFNSKFSKCYIPIFFSSNEFYENFCNLDISVIVAYSLYINNDDHNQRAILDYEQFLYYAHSKCLYANFNFAKKFCSLLTNIQNNILSDDFHMETFKKYYPKLFKFASINEIKNLKFTTILNLGLEKINFTKSCEGDLNNFNNSYHINNDSIDNTIDNTINTDNIDIQSNTEFEILYQTIMRDGFIIEELKNYHYKQGKIGNVLLKVLKEIILNSQKQNENIIQLLFFVGENEDFSDEEILKIKTCFSDFKNEEIILSKIMYSDSKLNNLIVKIFPNVIKNAFVDNLSKFNEKIETIQNIKNSTNLEDDLALLNTLIKINECDKFLCGICSVKFIENVYSCGHTICNECWSRISRPNNKSVNSKCPFCNLESSVKKIYLS